MKPFRTGRTALVGLMLWGSAAVPEAHEDEAPFSGAIVDPLRLHHAYLEDEQRVNFDYLRGVRGDEEEQEKRVDGFRTTLELAWASNDFRWGSEILLPYSNLGDDRERGIGDIEIQPVKYAFLNRPDTILSASLGFVLDTGSRTEGLGEGRRTFEPHLFLDRAIGNFFLGLNVVPEIHISGERGSALDYGAIASWSFIRGTRDLAMPEPDQRWVPAVSVELLGLKGIDGEERRANRLSVVPGLHLWDTKNGWHVRLGVELPVTSEREQEVAFLFQVGTHLDWKKLFGSRK